MAIKNYSAAAETLIQLSGGKENFITVENCATRVRIQYKDLSKVDKKAIGEMDGVLSVIEKDGLQVVVGPGVCNKLCAAIFVGFFRKISFAVGSWWKGPGLPMASRASGIRS